MAARLKQVTRNAVAFLLRGLVFPGRYRVLQMAECILGKNHGTFVVPLRAGGRLIVNGIKDSQVFYTGEFNTGLSRTSPFLFRTAKRGDIIFDVGANIGAYTVPLALRVGNEGHVYAFEALRANYEILLQNIALNALKNVTPVFGAVTDKSGTYEVPEVSERSENMGNYSLASESVGRITIPSLSLDDFVAENSIERINLMKIDIEGSETIALRGAHATFAKGLVKTVVCEFNPYWLPKMGSSVEELYEAFEGFGMEAFLITRFSRLRRVHKNFFQQQGTSEFDAVLRPRSAP